KEDEITIPVQVNGKLRDRLVLPADASEEEIKSAALASAIVRKYLEGKSPKKVIVAQKKLVNMEKLDADTLVTSCPGCMMRFEETFLQKNNGKKVKHIVQLLAEAYGDKEK
ncbi:MAG: hypothetical protein MUO78_00635, partial [candidate division Zixibacteria bacterium]|nr:hypothetical protein [candidate division Zixibacteria bacterium]